MTLFRILIAAASIAFVPLRTDGQVILTSAAVHEQQARPGEEYTGRIELTNSSNAAQRAKIYQTDQSSHADGRVAYPPAGSTPRSNARWVVAAPAEVVIPPGGKATISYTVRVPEKPALRGTYWSTIMVEEIRATDGTSNARRSVGIQTVMRLGVQVATHVGGAGEIRVGFDSVRASSAAERRSLSLDFVNAGTRAARLLMSVELFDAAGRPVRKAEQQRGLLYPGNSARQQFDFGALPAGEYTAVVTADGGGDELFGAQYTIRF